MPLWVICAEGRNGGKEEERSRKNAENPMTSRNRNCVLEDAEEGGGGKC